MVNSLKKHVISVLTLLAILLNNSNSIAQILTPIYPIASEELTRGLGKSELTVQIAFTSACNGNTVTIQLPESVTYVAGSVFKTAGSFSIVENNISNPRVPIFDITGVTGSGSITFTIEREAACGTAIAGKDSVLVSGSCGTASETSGGLNTYDIFAPALNLTPPAGVSNSVLGTTATRTITTTNGGNGDLDTLHFYIVYETGGIENSTGTNSITANGVSFTPNNSNGDTLFYKFFGSTLFGGDSLLTNGETVTILEPIEVKKCNGLTQYGAGWGPNESNICNYATGTGSITMAVGVPDWTGTGSAYLNYVNMCTPFTHTFTITNNGSGNSVAATMFSSNFLYKARIHTFNWASGIKQLDSITIVGGGKVIHTHTGGGDRNTFIDATQFSTDPDGAGGLQDLDGDGQFDDLAPGESVTFTLHVKYRDKATCGSNGPGYIHEANSPDANVEYHTMCNTTRSFPKPDRNIGGFYYYGASGFNPTELIPTNISPAVPFNVDIKLSPQNWSWPQAAGSNRRYEWRIILPANVSLAPTPDIRIGGSAVTHTVLPSSTSPINDTVVIVSTNNSLQNLSLNLIYACGTDGPISIPYRFRMIDDLANGCYFNDELMCNELITNVNGCPGPCPLGGPNTFIADIKRTDNSLGYTDGTFTTRVSSASLTDRQLRHALYLDTIQVSTGMIQNGAFTNLYQKFTMSKISGIHQITPLNAEFEIIRGGVVIGTCNINSWNDSGSVSTTDWEWDLSSCLPVGGILNGDSVHLLGYYVVSGNNSTTVPGVLIPNGDHYFYNKDVLGNELSCGAPVPELYLVGLTQSWGPSQGIFNASGCADHSKPFSFYQINAVPNIFETYRPSAFGDSIVYWIPEGYTVEYLKFTALATQFTADIVDGNKYVFINNGTWPVGLVGNSSRVDWRLHLSPTCSTPSTASFSQRAYRRSHYYADAVPLPNIASTNNGGYANATLSSWNVLHTNKSDIALQDLTPGNVVNASQNQEVWDVQIENSSISTANYVWASLENTIGSGISIDSVLLTPSNTKLTGATFANGDWYQIAGAAGLASGASQTLRVFFKYTKCSLDSIKFKAGWNCSAFPTPDPLTDLSVCSDDSLFLRVNPLNSQIQLSVIRQPGGGGSGTHNLCEDDSVILRINSALDANVTSPIVEVKTPTGVSINNPIRVEYPNGSGIFEYITPTAIVGGLSIDLSNHSGIGSEGINGLVANPGAPGRQARIFLTYQADCDHVSGNTFGFTIKGKKPCGDPAIGDNKTSNSSGINITGATSPGGVGLTFSLPTDTFKCGSASTLALSSTPVLSGTQVGDSIFYTLPVGMSYGGNFVAGTNCTLCDASSVVNMDGTTTVMIKLDPTVSGGSTMNYDFDVTANSSGGCGQSSIIAQARREIAPLFCGATPCLRSTLILTTSNKDITILRPDLGISSFTGVFMNLDADHTYSMNAIVDNSMSGDTFAAGDIITIEYYRDENSNGMYDPGTDLKLGEKSFNYSLNPGESKNYWASISNPATPDPTKSVYAVIDGNNAPNCLCSNNAVSPMLSALPVDLKDFKVSLIKEDAYLSWITASEENNDKFEILRMVEGETSFTKIGEVKGAGNSNSTLNYSYMDNLENHSGNIYYRLNQIDFNRKATLSEIRMVSLRSKVNKVSIYPNPATHNLNVKVNGFEGKFTYSFVDATGRVILTGTTTNNEIIDVSKLATGLYFLGIYNGNQRLEQTSIVIE